MEKERKKEIKEDLLSFLFLRQDKKLGRPN
jgi:hypothetical protein